jgi:hypothetical protein
MYNCTYSNSSMVTMYCTYMNSQTGNEPAFYDNSLGSNPYCYQISILGDCLKSGKHTLARKKYLFIYENQKDLKHTYFPLQNHIVSQRMATDELTVCDRTKIF